jgi:hypothetical protein
MDTCYRHIYTYIYNILMHTNISNIRIYIHTHIHTDLSQTSASDAIKLRRARATWDALALRTRTTAFTPQSVTTRMESVAVGACTVSIPRACL